MHKVRIVDMKNDSYDVLKMLMDESDTSSRKEI